MLDFAVWYTRAMGRMPTTAKDPTHWEYQLPIIFCCWGAYLSSEGGRRTANVQFCASQVYIFMWLGVVPSWVCSVHGAPS